MTSAIAISILPIEALAGQVTMSSLALVDFINSERGPDEPELLHKNFMVKIECHPGIHSAKFLAQYKDSTGRTLKCYALPRRESCLMAMSYSSALQTRVFDRMTELEGQAQTVRGTSSPKVIGELAIMECCSRLLRLAPSSQLAMLTHIAKQNGLDGSFLPSYVADAPEDAAPGFSLPTASLTRLLKANGISTSPHAYNALLCAAGMLEQGERDSRSKGAKNGKKSYWCVTKHGGRYGKNLTHHSSPRETQPHWYVDRFAELHRVVSAGLLGV